MNGIAKLTCGPRTFDLSGRYSLPSGINIPPGAREIPNISFNPGTSLGELVDKSGGLQSISWTVQIEGSSQAEVKRGEDDLANFLQQAGNPDNPLIYHWKPDDSLDFDPIWGTLGAARQIEILSVDSRERWSYYMVGDVREKVVRLTVGMQIQPYFKGWQMQLARATGGIALDRLGTVYRRPRGMLVLPALTNYVVNPCFRHNTWNTGWTAESGLTATKNTDREFTIFGEVSARLTVPLSSSDKLYSTSATAANTNPHILAAYLYRLDRAAITSADLTLYYNVDIAGATYRHLGNGLYCVFVAVNGIAGATTTGIQVLGRRTVFLLGMSLQEETYPSYPACGDFLGCSPAATLHESNAARAAGQLRIDPTTVTGKLNTSEGALYMVVKWGVANTHGSDMYLFSNSTTGLRAYFESADDKFYMTDDSGSASSAAQTFAAGDIMHLVFVWSASTGAVGTMYIYKDGALLASQTNYAPLAVGDYLYLGSNADATGQLGATIMAAVPFDRALTAAQVLALYNNHSPISADGQQVDHLPTFWAVGAAANQLDNCTDDSRDNWGAILDIPGDVPAETVIVGQSSSTFDTFNSMWLSLLAEDEFHSPAYQLFHDQSGTAAAALCGGEAKVTAVATTNTDISAAASVTRPEGGYELLGQDILLLARLKAASGTPVVSIQPYAALGTELMVDDDYKAITLAADYRLFFTKSVGLPGRERIFGTELLADANLTLKLRAKGTGTDTVHCDWFAVLPAPFIHVRKTSTTTAPGFVYSSRLNKVAGIGAGTAPAVGTVVDLELPITEKSKYPDRLELVPDKVNLLQLFLGATDADPVITYTCSFTVFITPRWSMA